MLLLPTEYLMIILEEQVNDVVLSREIFHLVLVNPVFIAALI